MNIELNKQLDKEVYLAFHDAVVGEADFGKKINENHPGITLGNYNKYIDDFYIENDGELEQVRKDTEMCFNEIQQILFLELQKYFSYDYSKKNYTCFLSIFNCNTRYLETKTFQVYYKRSHDMRKEVIAHELTHFAFYDFCTTINAKDDGNLWELSEIFNVLFLNLPSLQEAIGAEELLFYPDLEGKLKDIKEVWKKQPKAEEFIITSMQYLRNLE
ncbi:MAG: hypothetical protein NUV61_02395 [Candidatus Azambacteria bacterium]|nr:hypothetical protein [Candidatus Azambacteria bacterium]